MGKLKCAHLARFGIAPHFKSLLQCDVYQAEAFVLLFDESLNFENQKKQLDMNVRYWQHDQVSTRYFGSEFLGKGDADHLVKSFLQNTETLQLGSLYRSEWMGQMLISSSIEKWCLMCKLTVINNSWT